MSEFHWVHACSEWLGYAHLDHGISLDVIFKTLQLEMKHGRERLEDNAFLSVL